MVRDLSEAASGPRERSTATRRCTAASAARTFRRRRRAPAPTRLTGTTSSTAPVTTTSRTHGAQARRCGRAMSGPAGWSGNFPSTTAARVASQLTSCRHLCRLRNLRHRHRHRRASTHRVGPISTVARASPTTMKATALRAASPLRTSGPQARSLAPQSTTAACAVSCLGLRHGRHHRRRYRWRRAHRRLHRHCRRRRRRRCRPFRRRRPPLAATSALSSRMASARMEGTSPKAPRAHTAPTAPTAGREPCTHPCRRRSRCRLLRRHSHRSRGTAAQNPRRRCRRRRCRCPRRRRRRRRHPRRHSFCLG